MRTGDKSPAASGDTGFPSARSLSALLSQTLVAFTVEFDNQFELRMRQAGYHGALSLMVWSNLMRFVAAGDVSVHDLAVQAMTSEDQPKFMLGCLERWRFVVLEPDLADERPVVKRAHRMTGRMLRDGWGSGRGIRSGWLVRLTAKGRKAVDVWRSLPGEIERRWESRFGHARLDDLRQALWGVVEQLDLDLPQGVPFQWNAEYNYPKLESRRLTIDPLPVLLSQLLLAFTIEFDCESRVPLSLCANTLRVLGKVPVPLSEIPRLTGGSPETTDIGWQAKPFVVIEPDPAAKRGKVVRLSPQGFKVQKSYHALIRAIEERWQVRFGKEKIRRVRDCLVDLFFATGDGRSLLAEGLIPPEGTLRAGALAPALGRRDIGAATRKRMRDLVVQTEMFVRDPAHALPHYPLWDMNRGFGP